MSIVLRVLNLSPYWTSPARGGGQLRISNLNRCLATSCDIAQWSFRPTLNDVDRSWKTRRTLQLSPHYREIQLQSPLMLANAWLANRRKTNPDAHQSHLLRYLPVQGFQRAMREADVIQVEHPWLYDFADARNVDGKPLIYSSHNIEYKLIAERRDAPSARSVHHVQALETRAVEAADAVIAVSEEDGACLAQLRGRNDVILAPNGVDPTTYAPVDHAQREIRKKELGLAGRTVAVFAGGIHYPNIEAAEFLRELAPRLQDLNVVVLVLGRAAPPRASHDNFKAIGFVPDVLPYYEAADFALNPLEAGSGTSLKMFEFLSMGIPTITTPTGARGAGLVDGRHALIRERDGFEMALRELMGDSHLQERLATEGRRLVIDRFSWSAISQPIRTLYQRLANKGGSQ